MALAGPSRSRYPRSGFAPGIFDALASAIGVAYAPILAVTIAIAALVIKALITDIELTKLRVKHHRLVQKVALLEADLKELTRNRTSTNKAVF